MVGYTPNCLNDQIHAKKPLLTITLALVAEIAVGSDELAPQCVGPKLISIRN
jgi:hypothetical protein